MAIGIMLLCRHPLLAMATVLAIAARELPADGVATGGEDGRQRKMTATSELLLVVGDVDNTTARILYDGGPGRHAAIIVSVFAEGTELERNLTT